MRLTALLAFVLIAAAPATQPDIDALQKENDSLRAEVADLLGIISSLKIRLAKAENTTTPVKTFSSLSQVMEQLPADKKPPAGRKWDAHFVLAANDWFATNLAGRKITLDVTYRKILDDSAMQMPVQFDPLADDKLPSAEVVGLFEPDGQKSVYALTEHEAVKLSGIIRYAQFERDGRLAVTLIDSKLKAAR
jgi:hypothetical protein